MSGDRLSLGARQLLTFLRGKSGARGYCWWKQSTIAEHMERGLRTVNRQIAELVDAKYLESEPHGHGNHYKLRDLAAKVAYQQPGAEKPVESAPFGVAATPNWRSAPAPVSITETEEPEEKLAEQPACFPRSETQGKENNPSAPVEVVDYVREWTRVPIGGKMADEGTIRRLAAILLDRVGCEAWWARVMAFCRTSRPNTWGIMVDLAKDVAFERENGSEVRPVSASRLGQQREVG